MDKELKKFVRKILISHTRNRGYCKNCKLRKGITQFYNKKLGQNKVIILQNPGRETKTRKDMVGAIKRRDAEKLVEVCQRAFLNWDKFFNIFKNEKLKESRFVEKIKGCKNQRLFSEFYITDAVKCEGEIKEVYDAEKSCKRYFWEEIGMVAKKSSGPLRVITFGNVAFRFFRDNDDFDPPKLHGKWRKKETKEISGVLRDWKNADVKDVHGYSLLYEDKKYKKKLNVIHLVHLAREYVTLRDSYFEYFKDGLEKWD